jgi:hypothetical protein
LDVYGQILLCEDLCMDKIMDEICVWMSVEWMRLLCMTVYVYV